MDYVPFLIFLLYLYMYLLCDNKRYWIELNWIESSSSDTLNMIPPWNIHTVKVYAKELFQWLFFELVHSLQIL